jgi:hypothetical protein
MVCNRPTEIHILRNPWRLHNENGMAIRWPDGWGLWMLNGLQVDEQIVMRPETQTIEQIDAEPNNDIRAVRIQRYGWDRYLLESGADIIDSCKNEVENTREALARTHKGEVVMLVTCPSGRNPPPLRVHPSVSTCKSARRWLSPFDREPASRT